MLTARMQISIKNRIARVDSDFSFYDMERKTRHWMRRSLRSIAASGLLASHRLFSCKDVDRLALSTETPTFSAPRFKDLKKKDY